MLQMSWPLHRCFPVNVTEEPFCRVSSNNCFSLREKGPYSEFFWSVFSRIWTEYEEILRISQYSVRMRENTDQKNSE